MKKKPTESKWCLNCGRFVFLCHCRTTLPYWKPVKVETWIEESRATRDQTVPITEGL